MALVRRLQSYEQMKQAAVMIDRLPRVERDFFLVHIDTEHPARSPVWPDVGLSSLVVAMLGLMQREQHQMHHQITREVLSVRERMRFILQRLQQEPMLELTQILKHSEGRMGLVVTFLGLLELAKQSLVVIAQIDAYAAIHIWLNAHE